MDLHGHDSRRRPSINLDAGYVSISSINIYEPSTTLGLHGRKLICVIFTIISLFLISFINLICLLWLMYKLEWSLFDGSGSKVFRFDKYNEEVEFYKHVSFNESIYTTKINNVTHINLLSEKQIDIHGEQNSILFDDDQILLNTDKFYLKNSSSIDFTNLQSFNFDNEIKTRIHLNRISSQHIHNKHLNLTATNQLDILNITHAFFYSQNLVLEANRHNRRSILRFSNYLTQKKSFHHYQKISHENLHFKSDSVFFDLPRLPLVSNIHRSESGIYRICICNTTFLFLRSLAHQPCPIC
ncbi:unnamed protein product [Rotaria sp. Silwood1]|nr:unnamed protein product [Rotaria sp. Silwood1]